MTQVIYLDDDDAGICVAVDLDTLKPLPVVGAGPDRMALLAGFVRECPFDVTELDDDSMRAAFLSYLDAKGVLATDADTVVAGSGLESAPHSDDASEGKLADAEAVSAGDVPAEQPADTDTPESAPPTTVETRCWNCNGTGQMDFGDGSPSVKCGICNGTGKVQQPVHP